jgi:hypothetical protein
MDLAKTDEQRQIFKMIFARQTMGRPYLAPPGVPAERLAALRKGFMDTMTDKEFLDEAEANKFEINPVNGEELEALVKEVYRTPPDSEQSRRRAQVRKQIAKQRRRPRHRQRPVEHHVADERGPRGKAERGRP